MVGVAQTGSGKTLGVCYFIYLSFTINLFLLFNIQMFFSVYFACCSAYQ